MFVKNKEGERNSAITATTYAEKTIDLFEFWCDICQFKTSQSNSLLQNVKFHNMNFESDNASIN